MHEQIVDGGRDSTHVSHAIDFIPDELQGTVNDLQTRLYQPNQFLELFYFGHTLSEQGEILLECLAHGCR